MLLGSITLISFMVFFEILPVKQYFIFFLNPFYVLLAGLSV